jgi:type II secretory pathway pseudopilin PulG
VRGLNLKSQRGYFLIEILISLVVLGIGIGAILELVHTDSKAIAKIELRSRIYLISQSLNAYFLRSGFPSTQNDYQPVMLDVGIGACSGFEWILTMAETRNEIRIPVLRIRHKSGLMSDFPIIAKVGRP